MKVPKHEPGQFCWAELTTSDGKAATEFYEAILGCSHTDIPMGPDDVYTLLMLNGDSLGALYQDKSGQRPVCWGAYICVDSADDAAAKIKANGGTIMAEPFEVMTVGRMAVAQDPTGAVFNIWQPRDHPGYTVMYEPGAVCWNELMTTDTAAAEKFYTSVFGYEVKHSNMPMPYTEFQQNGKSFAGMLPMKEDLVGVPSHWLVYFTVADCADSIELAKSKGATLLFGPMAVPDVGNIAVIKDPQGAVFGIAGG